MSEHHHHHDHDHAEDNYYLDQMCLVALSALFGIVCLSLYFWRTDILRNMLAPHFFPFVLASGVALMILALLRGAALWIKVGQEGPGHDHAHTAPLLATLPMLPAEAAKEPAGESSCGSGHCGHEHGDGQSHSHAHDDGHVHAHEHDHSHDHAHAPHHGHSHGHSHGHEDHEHSYQPWRYAVVMLPILLFFLGIPSKTPPVKAMSPVADVSQEAKQTASWVGMGAMPMPLDQAAVIWGTAARRPRGQVVQKVDFQFVEDSASSPTVREAWAGKMVLVWGQFVPNKNPNNDRVFSLCRFRINCCRQDAVPLNVPIIASEGIRHVKADDWVKVTGEVQYRHDERGVYHTQLVVHGKSDVDGPTSADPDPYIR